MCLYYKVTTIFWMYLGEDWWAIIWTRPHQKLVDILCIHECPHTDDYNFWFSSSSSKRLRGPICLSLWVSNPNLSCYSYLTVQNKRHSNKCVYIEPIVFCQRVAVAKKKRERKMRTKEITATVFLFYIVFSAAKKRCNFPPNGSKTNGVYFTTVQARRLGGRGFYCFVSYTSK